MAPLLQDRKIAQFDILAIQEPWYNIYNRSTFNPGSSNFFLAHKPEPDTCTCFYINKRLNLESWNVRNNDKNLCAIKLSIWDRESRAESGKIIWIHNIYNLSLTSYEPTNSLSTFPKIQEALQEPSDHILLGDFNLHHLQWNNPGRFTYHRMADTLLNITKSRGLDLIFPKNAIT